MKFAYKNIKSKKIFALVDSNNFFASCEKVFRPDLKKKPVVVLSNNDGCIIARSKEAKALGIGMGVPVFKIKRLLQKNKVTIFSANFALYGNFSQRINQILQKYYQKVEIYSIDESFIDLTQYRKEKVWDLMLSLKKIIWESTGIEVSIGIGKTKTLAKAANKLAKKYKQFQGVCNFLSFNDQDIWLEKLDISDIWGVGRRYKKYFYSINLCNAKDMKYVDEFWIKKKINVQVQRTVFELNNVCCYPINKKRIKRKTIACTRSFGKKITKLTELEDAVSAYCSRAAEKLRLLNLKTYEINVFIRTNGYEKAKKHYSNIGKLRFIEGTNHTPTLVKFALQILNKIYKPGFKYYKAGVILHKLIDEKEFQLNVIKSVDLEKEVQKRKFMQAIDIINSKWGKDTIKLTKQMSQKPWQMKQAHRSPLFTTSWEELPIIL